jgi:putative flippase GtrA
MYRVASKRQAKMTSARQPEPQKQDRRTDDRRQGGRRHADGTLAIPASATDVAGWLSFFRQLTFLRYVVVSVGALAVDMGVFLGLLQTGMISALAAAIGYSVGIAAHWTLSSRKVFADRVSDRGTRERAQQKAMFVVSALLGLIVTMGIVGAGDALGLDPRIAKVMAIGISFILTYLLRNVVIFRTGPSGNT